MRNKDGEEMGRKHLGELEQLVLMAILHLGDEAYGTNEASLIARNGDHTSGRIQTR